MRRFGLTMMALVLTLAAGAASARSLTRHDVEMCRWGADIAAQAQQSKLSGRTLYSARRRLQQRHFSQPWMRKMALGITDQTYHSRSRLRPASVKQTYYQGCLHHEKARH
ncbi:hypothetical protein PMM47T1_27689 [Pseudomonas sp. M47T1]|uniref:hypothetical protein n=1 Tax=unclassified Pseudomonas TaxID=196821 RepID=UPI0002608686|nr:hypothetical protein [Pseudomonas sp. M47T1]EIK93285.1 hypothetical protein PMM47T1_27689 [Pseudomonas sp. M47T1]